MDSIKATFTWPLLLSRVHQRPGPFAQPLLVTGRHQAARQLQGDHHGDVGLVVHTHLQRPLTALVHPGRQLLAPGLGTFIAQQVGQSVADHPHHALVQQGGRLGVKHLHLLFGDLEH